MGLVGPHACMCGGCVRDGLVRVDTKEADIPGVPVLICVGGWQVRTESRAEATGVGETAVIAVT